MWGCRGETGELFYEYTPTKETRRPKARLADFSCVLPTDAFSGFDELFKAGRIVEVGCNAHEQGHVG